VRIGFHVRVGGGYDAAVAYAAKYGCTTLQFFSGNPKTYRVGAMDVPALERFARGRAAAGIEPVAIHTSYLINLASDDPKTVAGSLRLLENDLAVAAPATSPTSTRTSVRTASATARTGSRPSSRRSKTRWPGSRRTSRW